MMCLPDKRSIRLPAAAVFALMLSACTVGPDYVKPAVPYPGAYKHISGNTELLPAPLPLEWWKRFDDPTLNRLIAAAMSGNFDLMASVQRIEQARAVVRSTRAGLFPFISLDPSYSRTGVSKHQEGGRGGTFTTWSVPLEAAYEIDVFGRIRRSVEAGKADAEAFVEDDNSLRLILQTEIARNYFSLRAYDDDIRIVTRTIDVRRESLKILKNRFDLGVISRLPVAQAEAELSATRALLLSLDRSRTLLENAIAVLLSKAPAEVPLRFNPLKKAPPDIPTVLPSVLLESRPDIRLAERRMAAANARVGVAVASFYPQISISGNVGYESVRSGNLFDARSFAWGIFPNIHIPLFEGGRNAAELDRARASYAEVYALYRQAIVQAFGEVEDALVSVTLLEKQQAANQQAVRSAEEAYLLSRKQFEGGLINYLTVLDAERTLLDNLRLSSQLRGQRYLSAVALVKSIGGGWEAVPALSPAGS